LIDLVPQISYDIIARIIPGVTILFAWYISLKGPTIAIHQITSMTSGTTSFSFALFIIILMLAYTVSIILFGLIHMARNIYKYIFHRKKNKWKESSLDPIEYIENGNKTDKPSEALMFDTIREESKEAGSRLVKLRAEGHSAQILIAGIIIALITNVYFLFIDFKSDRLILSIIYVLLIFGAIYFGKYIKARYKVNLRNHWKILKG